MDDKDLPIIYEGKDIEDIIHMLVADSVSKILTEKDTTEKSMAWIEVYDDVLDEAYDMSQEYREYE